MRTIFIIGNQLHLRLEITQPGGRRIHINTAWGDTGTQRGSQGPSSLSSSCSAVKPLCPMSQAAAAGTQRLLATAPPLLDGQAAAPLTKSGALFDLAVMPKKRSSRAARSSGGGTKKSWLDAGGGSACTSLLRVDFFAWDGGGGGGGRSGDAGESSVEYRGERSDV